MFQWKIFWEGGLQGLSLLQKIKCSHYCGASASHTSGFVWGNRKPELWVLTDLSSNANPSTDALGDGGLVSYPFWASSAKQRLKYLPSGLWEFKDTVWAKLWAQCLASRSTQSARFHFPGKKKKQQTGHPCLSVSGCTLSPDHQGRLPGEAAVGASGLPQPVHLRSSRSAFHFCHNTLQRSPHCHYFPDEDSGAQGY